jgi:Xaa-Pro dipeptidase
VSLRETRRRRLLAAMQEADIAGVVLYGNAWQGDYLRYGCDFGILEGHGVAIVSADGTLDLFLDSATEAERAQVEVADAHVEFAPDIADSVAARLAPMGNRRVLAAPRRFLPNSLVNEGLALEDGTALLDGLLMHKLPAEIAASGAPHTWPTMPTRLFAQRCGPAARNMR